MVEHFTNLGHRKEDEGRCVCVANWKVGLGSKITGQTRDVTISSSMHDDQSIDAPKAGIKSHGEV